MLQPGYVLRKDKNEWVKRCVDYEPEEEEVVNKDF